MSRPILSRAASLARHKRWVRARSAHAKECTELFAPSLLNFTTLHAALCVVTNLVAYAGAGVEPAQHGAQPPSRERMRTQRGRGALGGALRSSSVWRPSAPASVSALAAPWSPTSSSAQRRSVRSGRGAAALAGARTQPAAGLLHCALAGAHELRQPVLVLPLARCAPRLCQGEGVGWGGSGAGTAAEGRRGPRIMVVWATTPAAPW